MPFDPSRSSIFTAERRKMNSEVRQEGQWVDPGVVLLPPHILRPTEQIIDSRLQEVTSCMFTAGVWQEPILVERSSLVVMDGHHRHAFALANGFSRVPCVLLSYSDVALESRREDQLVTPEEVIARGLEGRLFPAKSTRHTIRVGENFSCNFPLASLRVVEE